MHESKTESTYEDFSKDKEMFGFSNYSSELEYYDDSNKLVFRKMKDRISGFGIEEFCWTEAKDVFILGR